MLLPDDLRAADPTLSLPGFPRHPHRGIETITCMLGGRVEHGDGMRDADVIGAGPVAW